MHLKYSPKNTLHFQAQETQELNPDKSPLCQLVLKLTDTHQAQSSTASKTPIRVNKIINEAKEDYLKHWTNQTSNQSRMNSYMILTRNNKLANYLLSVRDVKQTNPNFLLHCKKYDILRQIYFTKLQIYIPDFADMEHKDKIVILLG